MATQHIHRLALICPVARQAAFNAWVHSSGLDSSGGPWLTVGLSPTGNTPATHFVCNAALTNQELRLVMVRLCQLASIAQPASWDTMSRQQRKQWLLDQRTPIRTATGIGILPFDNDGQWDSVEDVLVALGLKVITPALV